MVSNLLCAVAMFTREHRRCRKQSRRDYRNEFGHSGKLDIHAEIIVQNARRLTRRVLPIRRMLTDYFTVAYGRKLDVLRTLFSRVTQLL